MRTDMKSPITEVHLSAAQAAKLIRTDLKKAFPETKFSVRLLELFRRLLG